MKEKLPQLVYLALLFTWCFHIYQFYFPFELANQIALFFTVVASWWLGSRYQVNDLFKVVFLLIPLIFPLLLQPIVAELITRYNQSWMSIFIVAIACSYAIGQTQKIRNHFLGIGMLVGVWFIPYSMPPSQKYFTDKVIDSKKTTFADAQIVEWKDDFWLHYGGKLQFSTLDKHLLAEAYALPALYLKTEPANVLIIGGDNHLIIDQLNQSKKVSHISIAPFDNKYFDFVTKNEGILEITTGSKIVEAKLNQYLADSSTFDIIYIDQEVPNDGLIAFIQKIEPMLLPEGIIVFQSGNPYLQAKLFKERQNLIKTLSYEVLPYHTQVPTMGQVSWMLASKSMTQGEMRKKLLDLPENIQGIWWNQQAMKMMLAFGKTDYFIRD